MKNIITFSLIILTIILSSCKEDNPPAAPPVIPPQAKVTITLENVSCTEVWLKLMLENFTFPVNLKLMKDNGLFVQTNSLSRNDTIIYVDSLVPGRTYNFTAIADNSEQTDTSSTLQAATLDTTTHNFSYQTFEIGDPGTGNSSILWDVDIIDENNIWAVGEIYLLDSLGQTNSNPFNLARWDGTNWHLSQVPFVYQGQNFYGPIYTIFTFNDSDIWLGIGSMIHWDGISFHSVKIPDNIFPSRANKIWGTSSSDLYVVGNNGNIAHYNGSSWSSIESGTDLPLTDIYGNYGNEIYIAGDYTPELKGILLKGGSNQFSIMINSGIITENELFQMLYGELASVWVDENNTVYTGGNLLFRYKNNSWDYVRSLSENYIGGHPGTYYRGFIASIRGNGSNDYIIAGDRNTLRHFNGISWEQLGLPYDPQSPIIWRSVKMKGSTSVAVGDKGSKGFIILLKK